MNNAPPYSNPGVDMAGRLRLAGEAHDAATSLYFDRVARTPFATPSSRR